jgi:hypothetical protein
MQKEIKLIPYRTTENIDFIFDKYTYEKRITVAPCYSMQTLRKAKAIVKVSFDYANNVMLVDGKKFNVLKNSEFCYKKTKGNNIEASCIYRLAEHIKESSSSKNVFHHTTEAFLLKLNGNKISYIN